QLNFEANLEFGRKRQERRMNLYSKEFIVKFSDYLYFGKSLRELASKENHELLFNIHDSEYKLYRIFEYLKKQSKAENARHNGGTYGIYSFNDNEINSQVYKFS